MKTVSFLSVWLMALASCISVSGQEGTPIDLSAKNAKPHVIFILVDDMGWGDLDSNWSRQNLNGRTVDRKNEFKTPALTALAREGIQLRRHYSAAPVCAPARASLLLGVHQGNSRVVRNNRFDHPIEDSHTLGTVMRDAGYDTAAIGKWGVGGGGQSHVPVTAGPHQRGFNYFYGILDHLAGHFHYPSESRDIFEYNGRAANPEWKNIRNQVPQTAYSTDLFAARAKQWIVDQRKSARKTGKPFFLYLAFPAPHGSLTVPGAPYPSGGGLKGGLQWVKKEGTESVNTAFDARAEKDTYIHPDNARFPNDVAKRHSTMIRRVDDAVADLIHLLKDLKIDNDTMIIFTSDNGPHNEGGADAKHNHGAQNPQFFKSYGMMDGIKRDCWEGGMRVPTLVRWPACIPKGQVSLQPCQFHDWLATLADAAGMPVPARSDGVSLLPTLTGHADQQKPGIIYSEYNIAGRTPGYKDFLAGHKGAQRGQQQIVFVDGLKGLRMGVEDADKDFMIFDTLNDPQESKDIAPTRPELQSRMKAAALSNRRASLSSGTVFDTVPVPAVETDGAAAPGLRWSLYEGEFPWVPDFRQLKKQADAHGVGSAPFVNMGGPRKRGVELTGYVKVPVDGEYTFYLSTDANRGSKAFVRLHGMELIDADKTYEPGTEVSSDLGSRENPVYLKAGFHPIRISYVGNAGAASRLVLKWEGPGLTRQDIPASAFSHDGASE